MRNEMASIKVYLVKYPPPRTFDVKQVNISEKPMRVFDFKTNFTTSDITLIWRL